jgi:MFS family permease
VERIKRTIVLAWLIAATYYFYQYVLRSAPAVMMPQLADGFGISTAGVASLLGLFYFGYSPFSLVAGVAMDRLGPRVTVPIGAALVAAGALLFASGDESLASVGRFLQGAGGVFALVGAIYLATTYFPAAHAATLIGATQMFGMAGGSAGQFVVGPMVAGGLAWNHFWLSMGVAGIVIALALLFLIPRSERPASKGGWASAAISDLALVFRNPQSLLCGVIAGLMFIPTTIFDMVWGVRFLQEAHGMDYTMAVMRSASVPFGWIIGCPLLGFVSDRIGRRKPVIIAGAIALGICLAWILYGQPGTLPPYVLGILTGIASGAAMLTYTVIKEANPPRVSGSATGVVNFINFTFSAMLGPFFAWLLLSSAGDLTGPGHAQYQSAFSPMLLGVALAILLAMLLRETGPAAAGVRAPQGNGP